MILIQDLIHFLKYWARNTQNLGEIFFRGEWFMLASKMGAQSNELADSVLSQGTFALWLLIVIPVFDLSFYTFFWQWVKQMLKTCYRN